MAVHALKTTVKVAGAATAAVGEATSALGGQVYQVTNTAKRIVDPRVAVVVKDGGTPVAANLVSIDYLFGKFTLTNAPGGAVTADFSYLPMLAVAEAYGYELERSRELLDKTVFHATDTHRKRLAGLKSMSGSLKSLAPLNEDLDTGVGGTQSLDSIFEAGAPTLLEVRPGNTGDYYRAWVLLGKEGQGADGAGLVEGDVSFEGTSLTGTGQLEGAAEGWGS